VVIPCHVCSIHAQYKILPESFHMREGRDEAALSPLSPTCSGLSIQAQRLCIGNRASAGVLRRRAMGAPTNSSCARGFGSRRGHADAGQKEAVDTVGTRQIHVASRVHSSGAKVPEVSKGTWVAYSTGVRPPPPPTLGPTRTVHATGIGNRYWALGLTSTSALTVEA
jgi:hypothetical protein